MDEFPGLHAREAGKTNPEYISLVESVYKGATAECSSESVSELGFLQSEGKEPVSAYAGLRSSMAHATNLTLPPFHSQSKEDSFVSIEDGRLFRDMCDELFSEAEHTGISHPGYGSTSPPKWLTDRQEKEVMIDTLLSNLEHIRDEVNAGNWHDLNRDFDLMNLTFLQTRRQPEDPKKVRRLVTLDTLRTGLTVDADKKISEAEVPPSFGASRLRAVFATSATINWPFGTYQLYPFLKRFMNKYDATYKVRGINDMRSRIQGKIPLSVDVEQFDAKQPASMVATFFEAMADKLGEEWTNPAFVSFASPILAPPTAPEAKPILFGNVWKGAWPVARGLPSGHAANVPYGRLAGTFLMLVALRDLGIIKTSEWREVLLGRHSRVEVLNSSDDCVFLCDSVATRNMIARYFADNKHPYYDVDTDSYFQFLGMLGYHERGRIQVGLKASSYLVNMLCPERPAGGRFRLFPWTGFYSREQLYRSDGSPSVHCAQNLFRRLFRERFGMEWDQLYVQGGRGEGIETINHADLEVFNNPEAIHYKVDPDDLSFSVKEALTLTIPHDYLARYYRHVYQ